MLFFYLFEGCEDGLVGFNVDLDGEDVAFGVWILFLEGGNGGLGFLQGATAHEDGVWDIRFPNEAFDYAVA